MRPTEVHGGDRKNVAAYDDEQRADGAQRLLTSARWNEAEVGEALAALVTDRVGAVGTGLRLIEAAFVKKGSAAVGAERQYSVDTRRVENCQLALLLFHVGPRGTLVLIDAALYLPPGWSADPARRRKAGVPPEVGYRTKSELAAEMVTRVVERDGLPGWASFSLLCSSKDVLRRRLQELRLPYLLPLTSQECGEVGGPAAADVVVPQRRVVLTRAAEPLVMVRVPASPARSRAVRWWEAPSGCTTRMVAQARRLDAQWRRLRPAIHIDHYEVRSWRGWHRHMRLAAVANAAVELARADEGAATGAAVVAAG